MLSEYYTEAFYEGHRDGAKRSAGIIVPLLLQFLDVKSVVDVGCGDGSWLAVFCGFGVGDVLGIDGEYVSQSLLQIPQENFRPFDLTIPFRLERVFDLAVSLEVAEHLPADSGPGLVESLTRLAPAVLFSAAIPFQGGDNHINEQWQDKWAALFRERGYLPVDCIRKRVWQDEAVDWWYAQNTLLYADKNFIESHAPLRAEFEQSNASPLRLVHPRQFDYLGQRYRDAIERAEAPPSGVKRGFPIAGYLLEECSQGQVLGIPEGGQLRAKGRGTSGGASKEFTMISPLISVLITTYNYGRFVEEAIDSVAFSGLPARPGPNCGGGRWLHG